MSRTFARLSASKTALANDPGILTTGMKPISCGLPFMRVMCLEYSIRREIALALLRHRRDQPLEKAVDGVVVDPAHDRDKVVLGIDIDHIEPVAIVHKGGARRTWPLFAISVEEIVDESVGRLQSGRREGHVHPPLRQQLPVAPLAPPQREIAEARHVIGVDE